jgi:nucleoid-associated protein YgaU
MGLFSFVGDIGNKIFGSGDDDAAEKIKANIEENNPGVDGLGVTYADGTACLSGSCNSNEAKEKAILMAGNMAGVSAVDADGITVAKSEAEAAVAETAEAEPLFYTIESGDTLSKLAAKFLGDAMRYPEIFEANREVIQDPDKIFVGQVIRIPSV